MRTLGLEPPKPEASAPAAPAPGAPLPSEPAGTDGLPDFAKKADDLEAIKKAVDDAASVGGGLWLSYLFVHFYLAIAAGAVTHADLFLENPVKLPFLNVELPLLAFFFLAPILFLFVHAYTLVHLVFLTDKAKRFDQALSEQIGDDSANVTDSDNPRVAAIAGVRGQLPSNIFIQFLAGPRDRRTGSFGWLLRLIAWSTLAVAPILLLLLFQLQFLPFHLSWITWAHRLALVADLVLVWWLWRKILLGRDSFAPRPLAVWAWRATGALLTVLVVLFSWLVATFPGEAEHDILAKWDGTGRAVSLRNRIFQSDVDETTGRRALFLSNTLVLTGFNIYEGLKIDDPDKLKWRDFIFLARGRNLEGAIFNLAALPKVDFDGAELEGAALVDAQLQGASLKDARLQGAGLGDAQLQGASLDDAQLQGASLQEAELEGASLERAQLQGAMLGYAQLQGAMLGDAQLQGAMLGAAELQGASLFRAQLQGASLFGAQLQGASLQWAALDATDLSGAWLWRTNTPAELGPVIRASVSLQDASWELSWSGSYRGPEVWSDKEFHELREAIQALPTGAAREFALADIERLDCASGDKTLASCDPRIPPTPEAIEWRHTLEAASVDGRTYVKVLATTLRALVCRGSGDAIYIVRGQAFGGRLQEAGAPAIGLIDDLMDKNSKDCPVARALTDDDRASLSEIKQTIPEGPK